jgi:pyridoxal phosphate enzyme (YggS family)
MSDEPQQDDPHPDDQYAPERMRERLESVRDRVGSACDRAGRDPDDVSVIAVSKTHPPRAIEALWEAGVEDFGASYVQEWEDKVADVPDAIRWHFIGHLQSNKAKRVADRVATVQSVDRRSVTKQLHRRSEAPVDVLIQVNVAGDDSKSGVSPDQLTDLLETTAEFERIRVRGLMTLPPYADDPEQNRQHFRALRDLLPEARQWLEEHVDYDASACRHLSMGMTNDFEVAIEEGATMVRLGTALFGPRDYD